jgi:thiol-disulfide isomerase/thioredoxin
MPNLKVRKIKTKKSTSRTLLQKSKTRKSKKTNTVSKNKKHLVGKVYAEWCGACKSLQPNWTEMLTQLNGNKWANYSPQQKEVEMKKSIMVNKDGTVLEIIQIQDSDYDSAKNTRSELRDLEANGYPTIFRKKMHIPNSPMEYYNGDRTPEDMIRWAFDHSTQSNQSKQRESHTESLSSGGSKYSKHHNSKKSYRKKSNMHNKSFSQKISSFWGWK